MNNHSFALAFYLKCKLSGVEASTYCWQLYISHEKFLWIAEKLYYRRRISLLFVNSLAWVQNSHMYWAHPTSSTGPCHRCSSWCTALY